MGFLRVKIPIRKNRELMEKYWHHLWTNYSAPYSEVLIQCWNTEEKEMAELLMFSKKVRKEGLVHYFRIVLNEENRSFLKEQSFNEEKLKWLMVRFMAEDGTEGIEVSDYGAETVFNQMTTEEAEPLLAIFERDRLFAQFEKDEQDNKKGMGFFKFKKWKF